MTYAKVLDDVIPKVLADEIENTLLGPNFAWYFVSDITYGNLKKGLLSPAMSHHFACYDEQSGTCQENSPFFKLVKGIYYSVLTAEKSLSDYRVASCKSFLQMPKTVSTKNKKHVDIKQEHKVCLYYVNDVDGDTFLYGKSELDPVSQSITPKKGRVVLFDGDVFHCSSEPTTGPRAIINFNLVRANNG